MFNRKEGKIANTHTKLKDIFGDEVSLYKPIADRWGIYPLSVWELPNNKRLKELKEIVGDNIGGVQYGNWDTLSEFSPLLAELIVTGYTLKERANILDPFAGRGTRGLIAGFCGHNYVGIDISPAYVLADSARAEYHNLSESVRFIHGDSRELINYVDIAWADLIYTCPPYYNLEKYDAGSGDLSMLPTYKDFLSEINKVIEQCYLGLNAKGFCIWVIGTIRNKDGLVDLRGDIVRLFKQAGFIFFDDIVFHYKGGLKMLRLGTFDRTRLCAKSHEYVLVFVKRG